MRKTLVIVLILSLVFTVVACGYKNKQELVKSSIVEVNNLEGIRITEVDSNFRNTLMVNVINDLDQNALFSIDFMIEKLVDGNWYTMPYTDNLNHSLTEGAMSVVHNQYTQSGANWGYAYGDLPQGKYRMIKKVQLSDYDENNPNDIPNVLSENADEKIYYLSCEFEIE